MKLITEVLDQSLKLIEEEVQGQKRQFIEGIFMQAGIPNRNKRIYPVGVLQKEAARFGSEHITKNRAYGELGHPDGPNINLDRVAIHIKNLKQEGNNFVGRAQVASTPMGDILKGLIADGANVGVSTRALGSLKPISEGLNEVQDDLRLLAIDVVADPSAPDAYVNGIFEGKEWIFNETTGAYVESVIPQVKQMSRQEIEAKKFALFENFVNSLSKKPL